MKFKYYGKTFTGSRQEIIESLKAYLDEISQPFLTFNRLSSTFYLGEEEYLLSESDEFNVDAIRRTMVQDAIAKIPQGPLEIAIHSHPLLNYLLIDGVEVASQSKRFTVNQILEYGGIDKLTTNFDIKVEIRKLVNGQYALYFNDILVAHKDEPFTIYNLIHRVSTF